MEAGENDNVIVQKLEANKNAYGIFGYSFLEENTAKLKGVPIDGVEPDYDPSPRASTRAPARSSST